MQKTWLNFGLVASISSVINSFCRITTAKYEFTKIKQIIHLHSNTKTISCVTIGIRYFSNMRLFWPKTGDTLGKPVQIRPLNITKQLH